MAREVVHHAFGGRSRLLQDQTQSLRTSPHPGLSMGLARLGLPPNATTPICFLGRLYIRSYCSARESLSYFDLVEMRGYAEAIGHYPVETDLIDFVQFFLTPGGRLE